METFYSVAAVILLLFVCMVGYFGVASLFNGLFPQRRNPPKLAGTEIPQIGEGFDISKRYDIIYSIGDYSSQSMERMHDIKVVGYVGKNTGETFEKSFMRARWLVVEFADGRRAYLMPHSIISLVESAATS